MLFRGPHDSNDVGAVGARTESEYSGEEDETCSTSGRSYTSAESATAQSFEMRMAQLDSNGGGGGGSSGTFQTDSGTNTNSRNLLSPGYQLFSTAANTYGEVNNSGGNKRGDGPHSLTMVSGAGTGERSGASPRDNARADDYSDEDERDDDYLTALLSDIERHAARLDTQFFRYPSAESLKQQHLAAQAAGGAATTEPRAKGAAAAAAAAAGGGGGGDAAKKANATDAAATTAEAEGATKAEGTEASSAAPGAETATPATTAAAAPAAAAAPSAPAAPATTTAASTTTGGGGSSHSSGTKLFLGGLRYEVIQSGRHTVSWIFQVACGVHINPTSILIHRKTKNGRSNVAPTGCASVFVADDKDVATLLEMNQRIYCAEEGVYVSPSPDVMKELIASKDIVDVTGGRVRGPTHPVVIERAYSVSHHHGHHGAASNASTNASAATTATTATATATNTATTTTTTTTTTNATGRGHGNAGGGASGNAGGGGSSNNNTNAHRHARSPSTISAESNLSNQLMGGMPPPYGGALPPQYSSSTNVSTVSGAYHPPSYTPSSVSSGSLAAPPIGVQMMAASQGGYPPGAMMVSRQSSPSLSQNLDDGRGSNGRGSNTGGPLRLDPQRVTFHAYLRGVAKPADFPGAQVAGKGAAHTVLFLAALPGDATEDYVSWLFSLMAITLPAVHIHIIGGGATTADCCATVSVAEGDVSIALNYHHRVLCTSRGAWVGHSAQDIAALRASDASLRDAAVLHVDRRMSAQAMSGGGAGGGMPPGFPAMPGGPSPYPHPMAMAAGSIGGGGHGGAGASLPPPPTSYPPLFGAMQLPGGQGQMLPMAGPWAFAPQHPQQSQQQAGRPGMSAEAMYANLPPHPQGGVVPGLPPGALPISAMLPGGSAYSMPPPPPPFAFTQSVTIGDRTYQLPPGATVQYMPMMAANAGMGAPGDGMGGQKAGAAAAAGKSASSRGSAGGHESAEGSTGHRGSTPPHSGAPQR